MTPALSLGASHPGMASPAAPSWFIFFGTAAPW